MAESLCLKSEGSEDERKHLSNGVTSSTAAGTPVPFLRSTRCRLGFMILVAFINTFMHRVNFSLAVVCMVDLSPDDTDIHMYNINISNGRIYTDNSTHVNLQYADRGTASCTRFGSKKNQTITPELDWDKSQTSVLLSSYFYGSLFTQVPGGRMADRFGGKHVISTSLGVSGIASLLLPVCARAHIGSVFILRIFIGLAGGAIIPAALSMINVWAPIQERARTVSFCSSAQSAGYAQEDMLTINVVYQCYTLSTYFIGTIGTFLTSGVLCAYGFDIGWPSIFYIHGVFTLLFVLLWNYEVYNSPYQHPRISEAELDYIMSCTHRSKTSAKHAVPWRNVLVSRPVWASIITHFGYNWSFYTVLINIPLFVKEILQFDIQENGFYSSLPYVFCLIATPFSGTIAQLLISKGIFTTLSARKALTTVSLLGTAASVVGAGHVTCETRHIAVILLCAACMFKGLAFGGFLSNHAEYAGQFAGTLYGLSNAAGVVAALLSSMTAGLLTPNGIQSEWQTVFYVAASIDIIGVTAFLLLSSSDLQPWARGDPIEIVIKSDAEQALDKLNVIQEQSDMVV